MEQIHVTANGISVSLAVWIVAAFVVLFVFVCLVAILISVRIVRARDPMRNPSMLESNESSHALNFAVGRDEKHIVNFKFDQVAGWTTITVDGVLILKELSLVSFELMKPYQFWVGQHEVHAVRIERHRPLFLAFARPQPLKAFVDGILIADSSGIPIETSD